VERFTATSFYVKRMESVGKDAGSVVEIEIKLK
jgi:hypothetical protein